MKVKKPNVVQAEFFHVGGDPSRPFEAFMSELQERVLDGFNDLRAGMDPAEVKSGIKTCVRFYDYNGSLTQAITQAAEREKLAEKELPKTLEELQKPQSLIRRSLLYLRLKRLTNAITRAKGRIRAISLAALIGALRRREPIAIETWDHRFRPMRRDEAHELAEAAKASKNLWLFLFSHNDLLADRNNVVAHLT